MFNLLLALMVGILIGWNFNAFYSALSAPNIIQNEINISTSSSIEPSEKNISKEKIEKLIEKTKVESNITSTIKTLKRPTNTIETTTFYTLLNQNLFSDAMALYLDATIKDLKLYRVALKKYFQEKSEINPEEAIKEMLEYIELEPEHKSTKLQLLETYKSIEAYQKAIYLLDELIESSNPSELEELESNLLRSSHDYIIFLKKSKNFQLLNDFLVERIEHGLHLPFYTYHLAKYDVEMQKFDSAIKLLRDLEFDEEYGEKAKSLLLQIEKSATQELEYIHKFPLTKKGSHFTINVSINNTPLTLLLDTGATITMVNEEKLSSLTMISEDITLQTAGGEISGQILEAERFNLGDIELENFKVTTSAYKQKDADGLLGMNFFKEFKFKIDQDEQILYLSKRETF